MMKKKKKCRRTHEKNMDGDADYDVADGGNEW